MSKDRMKILVLSNTSHNSSRTGLWRKIYDSEKPDLVMNGGELGRSLIRKEDEDYIKRNIAEGRYGPDMLRRFVRDTPENILGYRMEVEEYFRISKDGVPRITVTPGNHDHFDTLAELCDKHGILLLHDSWEIYDNLVNVSGFGGGIEGFMWGPFCLPESEIEEKLTHAKNAHIFMLHPTPENYFDQERGKAKGSSFLKRFIEYYNSRSNIIAVGHPRIYGAKHPEEQINRLVIAPGGLTRDSFTYARIIMDRSGAEVGFEKYVEEGRGEWRRDSIEDSLKKIKLEFWDYE